MSRSKYLGLFGYLAIAFVILLCVVGDYNVYEIDKVEGLMVRSPLTIGQRFLPSVAIGLGFASVATPGFLLTERATARIRFFRLFSILVVALTVLFYFFGNLNIYIVNDDGSWWIKGTVEPGMRRLTYCLVIGSVLGLIFTVPCEL